MTGQERPQGIIILQGLLMLGIAAAPAATGFRFFFPRDLLDWLGTIAAIAGALLVVASARALRKTFTIQTAVKSGAKLSTDFPFNFSRNPMYVGGLILCLAWSVLQRSTLAAVFTVFLLVTLNVKVRIEERNLERVFGDEYRRYKERVRRFL